LACKRSDLLLDATETALREDATEITSSSLLGMAGRALEGVLVGLALASTSAAILLTFEGWSAGVKLPLEVCTELSRDSPGLNPVWTFILLKKILCNHFVR
jgi:hypothetical protein